MSPLTTDATDRKPLGVWAWRSLAAGVMTGFRVFMPPIRLAPHAVLSLGGRLISGAGANLLSLVLGRSLTTMGALTTLTPLLVCAAAEKRP